MARLSFSIEQVKIDSIRYFESNIFTTSSFGFRDETPVDADGSKSCLAYRYFVTEAFSSYNLKTLCSFNLEMSYDNRTWYPVKFKDGPQHRASLWRADSSFGFSVVYFVDLNDSMHSMSGRRLADVDRKQEIARRIQEYNKQANPSDMLRNVVETVILDSVFVTYGGDSKALATIKDWNTVNFRFVFTGIQNSN